MPLMPTRPQWPALPSHWLGAKSSSLEKCITTRTSHGPRLRFRNNKAGLLLLLLLTPTKTSPIYLHEPPRPTPTIPPPPASVHPQGRHPSRDRGRASLSQHRTDMHPSTQSG
jgi:hypothetical protein